MNNNIENNNEPVLMSPNTVTPTVPETPVMSEPQMVTPVVNEPVVEAFPTPIEVAPVSVEPVVTPVESVPVQAAPIMSEPQSVMSNPGPVMTEPVPGPMPGEGQDPNGMVNENLKTVEINYQPPSKVKVVIMVVFFFLMVGFVLFLPQITEMIEMYKDSKNQVDVKITTGVLTCTTNSRTQTLDQERTFAFTFEDSKLQKTVYKIFYRGDAGSDEKELTDLSDTCKVLENEVKGIAGVNIKCNLTSGSFEETQTYELASVEFEKLEPAFAEAGGTYPEYKYEADIDKVEGEMNASGYSCTRSH